MKPRKTISIYVLLVGVMGLSIAGGILAFQIFSAATKTQTTPEQAIAIKPIDGSINKDVIDNLTKRTVITRTMLDNLNTDLLTATITPTPTLTPTPSPVAPEATGSADIEE